RMVFRQVERHLDADLALYAPGRVVAVVDGRYLLHQLITDQREAGLLPARVAVAADRQIDVYMRVVFRGDGLEAECRSDELVAVVILDVEVGVAADHQIRIDDAANAEADILAEAVVE